MPFTSAHNRTDADAENADPEIVASQRASDANFKKLDETSGIAIAGFRDPQGRPLLWAHNEKTSHITLLVTAPARSLYAGAITMPGAKTRDAEDIAVVHDNGKGTIYLADTGANRKDMSVCIRYERKKDDRSQCSASESVRASALEKSARDKNKSRQECLARGEDWLWLSEAEYLAPGVYPAIRRIPEPASADAMRGRLAVNTEIIEFEYPPVCADKVCGEPASKSKNAAPAYNTEGLAVVLEPDHSHTAYLFTKAPPSLSHALKKQHPEASYCRFNSDGLSEVFRLRHIDSLSPGGLHRAEYVTTLDLSYGRDQSEVDDTRLRVTAANFLRLSDSQGLVLVRTTGHAFKWPVTLVRPSETGAASAAFDVAGALKRIPPVMAAVPAANKSLGVKKTNQEAAAQWDEATIYYMGECKGLPACSVTMLHDNHPYLAGDVDGDGRVDGQDAAALARFLSGEAGLYCKAAADVDGDGKVTRADLQYLNHYVARQGPAPVKAGARAGVAPALSCGYAAAANQR
jgi:hypothetical protein